MVHLLSHNPSHERIPPSPAVYDNDTVSCVSYRDEDNSPCGAVCRAGGLPRAVRGRRGRLRREVEMGAYDIVLGLNDLTCVP